MPFFFELVSSLRIMSLLRRMLDRRTAMRSSASLPWGSVSFCSERRSCASSWVAPESNEIALRLSWISAI